MAPRAAHWRQVLLQATVDPQVADLPPIGHFLLPDFILAWNDFRGSVEGEPAERLGALLRRHGIDQRLLRMVRRRAPHRRLVAITALGHLREERAWPVLEKLAFGRDAVTSFAAARALLRIEPRRALETLGRPIVQRDDWPLARLGTIFQALGPAVVTPALVAWLQGPPRVGLARVVKLARFGRRDRIAPIVRGWLSSSADPEVIEATLGYVDEPSDLPWTREAARHEAWRVRVAAAQALARVGGPAELAPLLDLLRDPVWWVRYHAAQALVHLKGLAPGEVERLRENVRDAFAADMLAQALAEGGYA